MPCTKQFFFRRSLNSKYLVCVNQLNCCEVRKVDEDGGAIIKCIHLLTLSLVVRKTTLIHDNNVHTCVQIKQQQKRSKKKQKQRK